MKIRVRDRLLVALAGLLLVGAAAVVVMEAFFGYTLAEKFHAFVVKTEILNISVVVVAAAILLLLGLYCICMLFRRGRRTKNFVVQKTESGELSISVKALEGLVQRCIDKHDELYVSNISLGNTRDGLVVNIKASLATGVNIPLTISNLQKQIKQYVTSCSGVDVKEVRVQVETMSGKAKKNASFTETEPEKTESPAEVKIPDFSEEPIEEKKRPLHQRLFGREEQPTFVPEPPAQPLEAPAQPEETPVEAPVSFEKPEAAAEPVDTEFAFIVPGTEETAEVKPDAE